MRILVVDDSAFMRKAISQMISSERGLEVVATARNGREAVELAARHKPDVITMDIEMPEMDGLTALRQIMRQCPTRVLMFSAVSGEGSQAALRALSMGAVDVLAKEMEGGPMQIGLMRDELVQRIVALRPARGATPAQPPVETGRASQTLPVFRVNQFDVVCIGSSTGGPPVLETVLSNLPAAWQVPIVIAQHMPAAFTRSMASRLASCSGRPVHHVDEDRPLETGTVHVATGGRHLRIRKTRVGQWALQVSDQPEDEPYKPSVNVLFESAAAEVGRRTLALVLTGIGQDGQAGAMKLREKGAVVLAQDQASCVVYGMPKAVVEAGLATASLTPQQMRDTLGQLVSPA